MTQKKEHKKLYNEDTVFKNLQNSLVIQYVTITKQVLHKGQNLRQQ